MRYSFWIRQGLLSCLQYALCIIIHFLLTLFMNFTATDLSEMDALSLTTPLIFVFIWSFFTNDNNYRTVIPTALSFCQTRADIIVGLQLSRLISLFFLTVLTAIMPVFSGFNVAALCVSSFLCLTTAGSMVGLAGRDMSASAYNGLFVSVILISGIAFSIIWVLVLKEILSAQAAWFLMVFSILLYGSFSAYEIKKLREFSVI